MAIRDVYVAGGNGIGYTKEVTSSADYAAIPNNTYFKDISLGVGGLIFYKDSAGNIRDIFSLISTIDYVNDFPNTAWVDNTLTVIHNLGTSAPKVAAYNSNELVTFTINVIDTNTITLTKNAVNPAPTSLKVGVSK